MRDGSAAQERVTGPAGLGVTKSQPASYPPVTGDRGDLAAGWREIVDSNSYMTLGTADAEGRPWVTPVWFGAVGYAELLWVSSPETRHSRNLAARPELSIVVFDSQVPEGSAFVVTARKWRSG